LIPRQLVGTTAQYQRLFTQNIIGRGKINYWENAYISDILSKNDRKSVTHHWVETVS
jgi:hypothetical protein